VAGIAEDDILTSTALHLKAAGRHLGPQQVDPDLAPDAADRPARHPALVDGLRGEQQCRQAVLPVGPSKGIIEAVGDPRRALLIAFSQGAITALHAVAAGFPVAGVIALSGWSTGSVAARSG
jgi:hypothetical protein